MANKITESDKEALKAMPNIRWFSYMEIWSAKINRPQYRMERLEAAGYLESRVIGEYPNLTRQYKKLMEVNHDN